MNKVVFGIMLVLGVGMLASCGDANTVEKKKEQLESALKRKEYESKSKL